MNEVTHLYAGAPDDSTAVRLEELRRLRKLWASIVLAALDDAIIDNHRYRSGTEYIARWARSRDGQEVLTNAGIDPSERVVDGLSAFVDRGVRTSFALSNENRDQND